MLPSRCTALLKHSVCLAGARTSSANYAGGGVGEYYPPHTVSISISVGISVSVSVSIRSFSSVSRMNDQCVFVVFS